MTDYVFSQWLGPIQEYGQWGLCAPVTHLLTARMNTKSVELEKDGSIRYP